MSDAHNFRSVVNEKLEHAVRVQKNRSKMRQYLVLSSGLTLISTLTVSLYVIYFKIESSEHLKSFIPVFIVGLGVLWGGVVGIYLTSKRSDDIYDKDSSSDLDVYRDAIVAREEVIMLRHRLISQSIEYEEKIKDLSKRIEYLENLRASRT